MAILNLKDLSYDYTTKAGKIHALKEVPLSLNPVLFTLLWDVPEAESPH